MPDQSGRTLSCTCTPHPYGGGVEIDCPVHGETGVLTPRTVNDHDSQGERCWICNVPGDHDGAPHAIATGDGLTRYDIIDYLSVKASWWCIEPYCEHPITADSARCECHRRPETIPARTTSSLPKNDHSGVPS